MYTVVRKPGELGQSQRTAVFIGGGASWTDINPALTSQAGRDSGARLLCWAKTTWLTEFANRLLKLDSNRPADTGALRYRKGAIADLMIDAMSIDLPESLAKTLGDRAHADMQAFAPVTTHSESTSAAFSQATEKRQEQVSPDYRAAAKFLDADLDPPPSSPGSVEFELNTCNSGKAVFAPLQARAGSCPTHSTLSPA